MAKVLAQAPANIKISGEHSVVYGGPSLSAAIGIFATAEAEEVGGNKLDIVLKDLNVSASLDETTLRKLYGQFMPRDTTKPDDLLKYVADNEGIGKHILPYATIAARLLVEQGANVLGKKVTIHSEVPVQKSYASSAVCSTAFGIALMKTTGKKFDDATSIDICRDGDRIIHKAEGAGRMDVGPAYFGGYVVFKASDGIKKADISTKARFIIIDTGPKPPTAEMVKKVRDLYNSDTEGTTKILREIDACVLQCIESLRTDNLKELGRNMSRNHELLKQLGVSSDRLDKAVSLAVSNGAYGAKLCGGGGGGMGVAVVGNEEEASKVISALKANGFDAFSIDITLKGANS